jgi:chemosensory pili system protein ChpA (sensor histidine kinase/response regulator)
MSETTQPATTLEVLPDDAKELAIVVKQNGLTPEATQNLQSSFAPFFADARKILEQSRQIVVTDASQKLQVKLAREYRLALRAVRIGADKTRKELKEDSDRKSKAIQGFYNILLHLTESEEQRLDDQEKFADKLEAERKAKLKAVREEALKPYAVDTSFMSLADMPDATFAQLLENTRAGHEAKLAAAAKAEADRIAAENERLKEEARIREENAKLKAEAEAREAAAKAERERVAKEKADAEEAARKEAARIKAESDAKLAEEKRIAKEKADAALKAHEEAMRIQAEKLEAIAAEDRRKAAEQAEAARKQREAAEAEQKRLIAERDAELERLARERKKADEVRRQEREAYEANQRAIQQAAEAKAKAAKDLADALAKKEREARERIEAELKAQRDAEAKRAADAELARKKAEAAPDKDKLLSYAMLLNERPLPVMETLAGKAAVSDITDKISALVAYIEERAAQI